MAKLLHDLRGIEPFNVLGDPTTVGGRWRKCIRSIEFYAA